VLELEAPVFVRQIGGLGRVFHDAGVVKAGGYLLTHVFAGVANAFDCGPGGTKTICAIFIRQNRVRLSTVHHAVLQLKRGLVPRPHPAHVVRDLRVFHAHERVVRDVDSGSAILVNYTRREIDFRVRGRDNSLVAVFGENARNTYAGSGIRHPQALGLASRKLTVNEAAFTRVTHSHAAFFGFERNVPERRGRISRNDHRVGAGALNSAPLD
jgi:hypothetical protein